MLLNTAAFHLPAGQNLPLGLKDLPRHPPRHSARPGLQCLQPRRLLRRLQAQPDAGAAAQGIPSPYDSWKNRIATLRFVQDIPLAPGDRNYDLVSATAAGLHLFRELPMILIWGELDFVFDTTFLAEWQERFPAAEVHRFPDAGHYILEDAKEEVVPLIDSKFPGTPTASLRDADCGQSTDEDDAKRTDIRQYRRTPHGTGPQPAGYPGDHLPQGEAAP